MFTKPLLLVKMIYCFSSNIEFHISALKNAETLYYMYYVAGWMDVCFTAGDFDRFYMKLGIGESYEKLSNHRTCLTTLRAYMEPG
jgi:hypothetical protein